MTRFFKLLAVLIVFAVGSFDAAAQVTMPSPSQQDRVFQGTLIEIDTAKVLIAKAGDNTEKTLSYKGSNIATRIEFVPMAMFGQLATDLE